VKKFATPARQSRRQPRVRRPGTGFTLIELMIGLTIGLVILIALSTLFLNTSNTNRELAKMNAIIEHGRFALQLIENDLVHAGFWGTHVPDFDNLALPEGVPTRDDLPSAIPDPCLGTWPTDPIVRQTLQDQLIGLPVQAYADPTAATMASCTTMTNRRPGTHVLLVRHAATCAVGDVACEPLVAGRVYIQSSLCPSSTNPPMLQQLADTSALEASGFDRRRGDCDASNLAELRQLVSNVYFIRDGAVPTLARIRYDGSGHVAEDLIEGIEDFRVELGIDNRNSAGGTVTLVDLSAPVAWTIPDPPDPTVRRTSPTNRGDGMPNEYLTCPATGCSIEQLVQTVSARLFVLARSPEATQGYEDPKSYCLGSLTAGGACPAGVTVTPGGNFKRHLFTTTVRLNNVSGRRETPP
jgi:type IV pilus assembly protein PilW